MFLAEKSSLTTATHANDEASSCSSTGAGDESSTSSSTTNPKQSNPTTDIDTLPPNKRRLRERNAGISNASVPSATTDASTNSTGTTDNSSTESATAREVPVNSIKQFLEIRQQVRINVYNKIFPLMTTILLSYSQFEQRLSFTFN